MRILAALIVVAVAGFAIGLWVGWHDAYRHGDEDEW